MSSPTMVHEYQSFADVEMDDGEVFEKVELCSHFLSEAHTNPQAIQTELDRRRRAALQAEGKLDVVELEKKERRNMENDKYLVFKAEDVYNADRGIRDPEPIEDAVVIRLQDVFAGPGLYAYANAIQTGLDLDLMADECGMDAEDRERLEAVRDFFATMAQKAVDHDAKKIPD